MFGFLYSIFAYVAFLASFGYLAFFANDLLVPFTVDSGQPGGAFSSVLVDVGLILLFGVQHSVMARDSFKRRITRVLPAHLERSTYVLASALALVVLYAGWQPVPGLVWHVETPALRVALYGLNALGWVGVPVASFLIDHFDLFGLKQAFAAWRKRSFSAKGFVTPVLYRHCRHPMMTALMVGLWAAPDLTVGHAVLSAGMTLYIVIGVHFEERALRRELGEAYAQYQQRTPKFVPRFGSPRAQTLTPAAQTD